MPAITKIFNPIVTRVKQDSTNSDTEHMKVGTDHFLNEAKRELVPGNGTSMPIRRALIIHFTSGATAMSSINFWRDLDSGIGAHIVIDRDGTLFQSHTQFADAIRLGVRRSRTNRAGGVKTN